MKKLVKNILNLCSLPASKNLDDHPLGSAEWLILCEKTFGGYVKDVPRNKVSPQDPRSPEELKRGGMIGGDRMKEHMYAKKYSDYIAPYLINENLEITIAEFGILKGTGLALWCKLFDKSRVLGFDIDLSHIERNMNTLKNLGAFKDNHPELYEYDQFIDNKTYLGTILKPREINICIDDGHHSIKSIMTTLESTLPYLADDFVYFIEDNAQVHNKIKSKYQTFNIDHEGELTVLTRKKI